MKAKLVAGLVLALVLVSGCAATDFLNAVKPKTGEERAIAFTQEKIVQAKALSQLGERFEKTADCSTDEYLSIARLLETVMGSAKTRFETDPAKAALVVAKAKACAPHITVQATKKGADTYLIEYKGALSDACPEKNLAAMSGDLRVVIETNTATGKAKVVEGNLDDATKKQVEAMLPGIPLTGNCAAALILGSGQLKATEQGQS